MAPSQRPSLDVEERPERGSRSARRLRRAGLVPGILYGGGDGEAIAFKVGDRDLRHALQDASAVVDVKVAGQTARPVIVKDQQVHPVRGDLVHVDLLQVRLDEKIQSTVALELEGVEDAPGVKEGGVLEHVTREVSIEALPTSIPDGISVDVSHMEVAATMHLSEVTAPEGVELLDDLEETIVATITVPSEVVEEPELEEETELVGEEGEAAEGEGEAAEGPGDDGAAGEES